MIEKYLEICELLDQIGDMKVHLDLAHQRIKSPDFYYSPEECPEILTNTFLACSYWLDKELFDESCLYKKDCNHISSHVKMLDIGCTLIDKGFTLEYDPTHYKQNGLHQLGGYVKTFAEQCHKRHAFLHEKIAHKTNSQKIIPHQIGNKQR